MSTTTEILFNSPALHSLKREQLVKLCKIHAIKASGKNVDLIHKLRLHAQTLPKDSPLSIAARSEEHGPIPMQLQSTTNMTNDEKEEEVDDEEMRCADDGDESAYQNQSSRPPRPSEQWEMVMDSIEELEEEGSSQGTLTSIRTAGQGGGATGEFGTGGSSSRCKSWSIHKQSSFLSFFIILMNGPFFLISLSHHRLFFDKSHRHFSRSQAGQH